MFHHSFFFFFTNNNRPNLQKLTYQLLQQRHLERSTNSKNLSCCDTEQIGPPSPPDSTVPCDHQTYFDYNDDNHSSLLPSPPLEDYKFDVVPQLQSNNHHYASKSSDFCSIKPIYKHHHYHHNTTNSSNNIPTLIRHLALATKNRPNLHLSLLPIEPKLLIPATVACQNSESDVTCAALSSIASNLKAIATSIKSLFFFHQPNQKATQKEKVSTCCTATSEYVAAGKLHYIISQVRRKEKDPLPSFPSFML